MAKLSGSQIKTSDKVVVPTTAKQKPAMPADAKRDCRAPSTSLRTSLLAMTPANIFCKFGLDYPVKGHITLAVLQVQPGIKEDGDNRREAVQFFEFP